MIYKIILTGIALVLLIMLLMISNTKLSIFHNPKVIQPMSQPSTIKSADLIATTVTGTNSVLIGPGEWNDYISQTDKYSIKYPPNWEIITETSKNGGVVFKLKNPIDTQKLLLIGVTVTPLPKSWNIHRVIEERMSSTPDVHAASIDQFERTVDGRQAVEITGIVERFRTIEVVFVEQETLFTVWARPFDPSDPTLEQWTDDLDNIFHQMVNSFRFLA